MGHRISNFAKGKGVSICIAAMHHGIRAVLSQCTPNIRGQIWRECGLHETHFFAYLRGDDKAICHESIDAICEKMGISVKVSIIGMAKGGIGSGSVAAATTKWNGVDWTKNDTQIAEERGVSKERVRQVRRERGMPASPHKWGKGMKK